MNVTGSTAFENYFLSQNSNFQQHPLRIAKPQFTFVSSISDEKLWLTVFRVLNASSIKIECDFDVNTRWEFDLNYDEATKDKIHTVYGPVHSLSEHDDHDFIKLTKSIEGSIIYKCLLKHTGIKDMFTTPKAIVVFKELVIHSINTIAINRSVLNIIDKEEDSLIEFATGVYPLRSMLSHSCAPNVLCTSSGKKTVFTILKSIKAGEQLFDNYV